MGWVGMGRSSQACEMSQEILAVGNAGTCRVAEEVARGRQRMDSCGQDGVRRDTYEAAGEGPGG